MDFNEPDHPQLINFWYYNNLRWPPQLIHISWHKNGYDFVRHTEVELQLDVVVAERHLQHMLQVPTLD